MFFFKSAPGFARVCYKPTYIYVRMSYQKISKWRQNLCHWTNNKWSLYLGAKGTVTFMPCLKLMAKQNNSCKSCTPSQILLFSCTAFLEHLHLYLNFSLENILLLYVSYITETVAILAEFLRVTVSRSCDRAKDFWVCVKSWDLYAQTKNFCTLTSFTVFSSCFTPIIWF